MSGRIAGLTAIFLGGVCLAACATVQPRYAGRAETASSRPSRHVQAGLGVRGTMRPYQVGGITYTPRDQPHYDETGVASWYGPQFHQRSTADGEVFDMDAVSAAHTTLPLPSIVEVTNLDNHRSIRVRVNDRGPFVGGRIIDLSRGAARQLGFYERGTAHVRVRYIGPAGPVIGDDLRTARANPFAPPAPAAPETRPADPPYATAGETVPASGPLRVQVGAFSTRSNAERAAGQFGMAAVATIDTVNRGGVTLYRVTLSADPGQAQSLRDQAASAGFPDARIVGF